MLLQTTATIEVPSHSVALPFADFFLAFLGLVADLKPSLDDSESLSSEVGAAASAACESSCRLGLRSRCVGLASAVGSGVTDASGGLR